MRELTRNHLATISQLFEAGEYEAIYPEMQSFQNTACWEGDSFSLYRWKEAFNSYPFWVVPKHEAVYRIGNQCEWFNDPGSTLLQNMKAVREILSDNVVLFRQGKNSYDYALLAALEIQVDRFLSKVFYAMETEDQQHMMKSKRYLSSFGLFAKYLDAYGFDNDNIKQFKRIVMLMKLSS